MKLFSGEICGSFKNTFFNRQNRTPLLVASAVSFFSTVVKPVEKSPTWNGVFIITTAIIIVFIIIIVIAIIITINDAIIITINYYYYYHH